MEQRSWARQLRDAATAAGTVAEIPEGAVLPPHHAACLGCGPKALAGYHLQAVRRGDEVVAEFTFQAEHSGGPGLAHGGAVATVCDDLLGHVFFLLVGAPGVTRRLEVDYLAPVVLGARQQLTARLVERDGRKLWVECEGARDGTVHFRARALMIHVDLRHFLAGLSPEQRMRAEAYLAEHGGGGDANAP